MNTHTLHITRNPTPRIGSRNWARSLSGEWTAHRATFGDCATGWQIRCGFVPIAVIIDGTTPDCSDGEMLYNMRYAGGRYDVGISLYRDLVAAVAPLTEKADDEDDSSPIIFSRR